MITGFRLCRGGAAQWYGVQPDIWCFGKVIGGGLPVGAFGASTEIMSGLAPSGRRVPGGNAVGESAGHRRRAGLCWGCSTTTPTGQLEASRRPRCRSGLEGAFAAAGSGRGRAPRVGPLLGLFFTEEAPNDFDEARKAADNGLYPRFFHGMLNRGIAFAPGAYEAIFPSLAHTEAEIEATIAAATETAREMAAENQE